MASWTKKKKYIEQWIKKQLTGKDAACPLCKSRQWDLLPHFLELRPYHKGAVIVGGAVYPHFGLVCKTCGYTALINAVAADVLPALVIKTGGSENAN